MLTTCIAYSLIICWAKLAEHAELASKQASAMYPLVIGSKWTYSAPKQSDIEIIVSRKEKIGGIECTVLESSRDGKVLSKEYVAVIRGQYQRFRIGEIELSPPVAFAKTKMSNGDKWECKSLALMGSNKTDIKIDYVVERERVKVPAGIFDTFVVAGKTENGTTRFWYSAGTGPVKIQYSIVGGESVVLELKSFTKKD